MQSIFFLGVRAFKVLITRVAMKKILGKIRYRRLRLALSTDAKLYFTVQCSKKHNFTQEICTVHDVQTGVTVN